MTYKQRVLRGKKLVALSVAATDWCWRKELAAVYAALDSTGSGLMHEQNVLTKALTHVNRALAAQKILVGEQ